MTSNPTAEHVARLTAQFVSRDLARRDLALDAFRGLMILGMILVNHAPPTTAIYPPLVHAAWNGWTFADTIFPGFLFAVGVSVCLSMPGRDAGSRAGPDATRVLRRFALLMVLNVLLINFPYYFGVQLRFGGTLALIAWSYLFAASLHMWTRLPTQVAVVVALLGIQWAALGWMPSGGAEAGTMTPDINAARHLDATLFAPLFGPAWTGQGSETIALPALGLPALGAVASTMLGVFAARWMRSASTVAHGLCGLFAAGFALLAAGDAWDHLLPVNKALWTGSYVLLMGGISVQLYAIGVWLVRVIGVRSWAVPLQVAGANALFFYVLAQAAQRILVYGRLRGADGSVTSLRELSWEAFLSTSLSGAFGSLVYAIIFLLLCYAVIWVLYRRRIFLRL